MSYKYNNIVIKPGLYLGDLLLGNNDNGALFPIFSSMQLSLDGTNDMSRQDNNISILPGYKAILYKNTDISYITVNTIDNTNGINIMSLNSSTVGSVTGYNPTAPDEISKIDLFYNNVKIDYSNIKTMGFKAAARLCWGAKLGQYSDGSYNKYALILESSTPRLSGGQTVESTSLVGINRPYLSLPWVQAINTTKASHSFWWCSKGYENGAGNADINYALELYSSGTYSNGTILNFINNSNIFTEIFFEAPTTGNLTFYISNVSNSPSKYKSLINICDGLWHHIVWNINGTNWTIYTDGVAEATVSKIAYNVSILNNNTTQIGARGFVGNDTATNGYIADYRFYKDILTTTDINGLLNGDHTYKTSLDPSSCLFQYTFDPDAVYTNNYTTYAIGAATVPYAAELRNGAEIMMPSMDLTGSLGKNIKILPFTIGSNGFSISFWWRSDGLWAKQGENSRLFYLGNGDETSNITFSLEIGTNGYPSISINAPLIWYRMEGNATNSGSGSGFDGTLVGTASYDSTVFKRGSQSLLSNTSSYISIPTLALNTYTNGFTIAFWFYRSGTGTETFLTFGSDAMKIISFGTGTQYSMYFEIAGYNIIYTFTTINTWNHFAITLTYSTNNTSTWKLYIDGILNSTYTNKPYPTTTYSTNSIGQITGYMDDFRIYQNVLSDAEILNVSNNTLSNTKDLTTLTDFSDDTWKHVVWTMTPESTWKLYVNNALINTYTGMAYPDVIQRSTNYIGSGYLTTDGYPCGFIGDFRMYNATLSSDNVKSLYNRTDTSDNEINLIQHYDFVEETMNVNNNILYSNAPRYALELTNVAASDSASPGQYGSMTSGLAATGTTGLTFSFWWKAKGGYAAQGTWARIFDFADNTSGENSILFACKYGSNLYPAIEIIRGTANKTTGILTDLTDFCDGDWKHVVWTMTSATTQTSTWNLYVNNKRYGLGNLTTTGWYPNDKTRTICFIGKSWAVNDGYPNGHISDVRVYGEVFTPQKITDLYNKVYTSTTNVILHTLTPNTKPPKISDKFLDLINTKSPWGIYFADSHDNNILYEARKNGRDATTSGITKNYASGNGAAATIPSINGTTTSTITWPTGSIPTTFTVCSITRYTTSANDGRILVNSNDDRLTVNFLHGHWGNRRGVAHYNAWKSGTTSAGTLTDWLVMCGTNGTNSTPGNILRDGTGVGTANGGTGNSKLSVNSYEPSNFALSTVFIWDVALTNAEMLIVSNALTYYLSSGMPINLGLADAKIPTSILGLADPKIPTSITQIIPYNSLYLDGTAIKGAQASLTADLITNAGVSFAFWFKPTGTHGADNPMIFDFGNGAGNENIFFGKDSVSNYPYIKIYQGLTGRNYVYLSNNSTFFSKQVWKHTVWTMTYSAGATSTWNVYINGKQYDGAPLTTTGYYPNSLARSSCLIGKSNWSADGLLSGQIADFRVYNRVLSQANVTALYNGIYTDNTSLFLQYPIDKAGTTNPSTITFTLQSSATIQQPTMLLATDRALNYHRGSYLSLPPLVKPGTNGLSFSIWWRAGATYGYQGPGARLFSFSNGKHRDAIEFCLRSGTNSYPNIGVHNGIKNGYIDVDSITSLCDGTWKHIVWTMTYCAPTQNTSTWILYVNGTALSTVTTTGFYPTNVLRKYAYIGQSSFIQDRYPTGDFADFRVYGAVLTQANVNSLYALSDTTDNENNLLLRQKFDSTESYLYQTCDNIKPSVLLENDPAITNTPTGQHVVLPALPGLLSTDVPDRRGISISFWWKSKGLSGISGMLFESGFAQDNDVLFLRTRDGLNTYMSSQFYYGTGNDVNLQFGTADGDIENLENGEWHHIVWTMSFEGNSLNSYWKYYMDGYFIKTTGLIANAYLDGTNNTFNARQVNNFIGRSNWSSINGCLNGYMSDFRIYNNCLTIQDVGDLYTNTYDDNSDLFLRYSFEKKIQIDSLEYTNIKAENDPSIIILLENGGATVVDNDTANSPSGFSSFLQLTGTTRKWARLYTLTKSFASNQLGLSFSFWFKPTGSHGTGNPMIFDFGNAAENNNVYFAKQTNVNYPYFGVYKGTTNSEQILLSNTTGVHVNDFFSNQVWKHIVWTMTYSASNTSTWNVYFNGQQYSGTAIKTNAYYPNDIGRTGNYIGDSNWTTNGGLSGNITGFRIYTTALTQANVTALYNNTFTDTTNLFFSTDFKPKYNINLTPSHSTDTTQVARLYNGATLSTDTYKFGTSSLFLSNYSTTANVAYSSGPGYGQCMQTIAPLPKLGTNGISFSFWWKSAGLQGSSSTIFDFAEDANNRITFYDVSNSSTSPIVQLINGNGTKYDYNLSKTNFNDSNWHHVVWNIDKFNNTWELFYDNVSSTPINSKMYPENVSRPYCFFGRSTVAAELYANGYIDEFRIYSKVLTATDVDNLYNNIDTTLLTDNLIVYYSFNQDASKKVMDEKYIDNNVLDTPIFNT